jgi:mRNA interferase MazF
MREGDVALTPLPQADGRIKNRPVILLRQMPPFRDWLVCGVSTQIHQQAAGFDETIEPAHTGFASSGLKAASLIRLGFLATLPAHDLPGIIGSISAERHQRLLRNLARHLQSRQIA